MKNSSLIVSLSVSVIFILSGCLATSHIEKADDVNLSRYRTFGWATIDSNQQLAGNDIINANIKNMITEELEKKGMHKNERNPDLLLEYNVAVEKDKRQVNNPVYSTPTIQPFYNPATRRISNYYIPSQLMGYDNYEVAVQNGMLTINIYDARSKKLIWQGWSQNELRRGSLTTSDVKQNVHVILKKLDTGS
jgi:Domain of unknown function (DUF4136)